MDPMARQEALNQELHLPFLLLEPCPDPEGEILREARAD